MDSTEGDTCPRCGADALKVFYPERADGELGAVCQSCSFKGFYLGGKLIALAA